jgi:enoyl-CoA hydratase/carnithine racemase
MHPHQPGLVSKVVPADKTVEVALEMANKIASFSQVFTFLLLQLCLAAFFTSPWLPVSTIHLSKIVY